MKLYGIPNCNTVKKARAALTERNINYEFIDYKKHPITEALLQNWLAQTGWQKLLKKTGPTWGKLPPEIKASIQNDEAALQLMLAHPNTIKRPVLVKNNKVLATGFDEAAYANLTQ